MQVSGLSFSIAADAAWAPELTTREAWLDWARTPSRAVAIDRDSWTDPAVAAMPAMLRRRAGPLGKMALEVAYACSDGRRAIPVVFCSRHGDVARALTLLDELARAEPLSPTSFGLAVHNASAGLFSIARVDRANHLALAAGAATVEHGVLEACGLLADGAAEVLLVAYDAPLPALLAGFADCAEQPHAWAWLLTAPADEVIELRCESAAAAPVPSQDLKAEPGSLAVLRFFLSGAASLQRQCGRQRWIWTRRG